MAIDLQKLEQKFQTLFNDPNFEDCLEKWLEARMQQTASVEKKIPLLDGKEYVVSKCGIYPDRADNRISTVNPIVDICGYTIDLRKVERVSDVYGDRAWLKYSVYFTSGSEIEIFHERKYVDHRDVRQMKREEFVQLWRSFIGC